MCFFLVLLEVVLKLVLVLSLGMYLGVFFEESESVYVPSPCIRKGLINC